MVSVCVSCTIPVTYGTSTFYVLTIVNLKLRRPGFNRAQANCFEIVVFYIHSRVFLCGFDYCYGVLVINDTSDLRYASVSIETVQRITYFIKKGTDRHRRREKVNALTIATL